MKTGSWQAALGVIGRSISIFSYHTHLEHTIAMAVSKSVNKTMLDMLNPVFLLRSSEAEPQMPNIQAFVPIPY